MGVGQDVRFKKIRVLNEHFHEEIGSHTGGIEAFLAVGYRQNHTPEEPCIPTWTPTRSRTQHPMPQELFLVMEEPDPVTQWEAWQLWLDRFKLHHMRLEALSAELKEERLGGKEADWAVLAGERKARQPEVTPEAEPYRHGGAMLQ